MDDRIFVLFFILLIHLISKCHVSWGRGRQRVVMVWAPPTLSH